MLLKERTQTINNKIKIHILGVPMNKLDNWLIAKGVRLCVTLVTREQGENCRGGDWGVEPPVILSTPS